MNEGLSFGFIGVGVNATEGGAPVRHDACKTFSGKGETLIKPANVLSIFLYLLPLWSAPVFMLLPPDILKNYLSRGLTNVMRPSGDGKDLLPSKNFVFCVFSSGYLHF